ncbi:cilia- and flagella-associated protein 299 [Pungitius pungitius]|uniref:cilia- and flagella-associated protein 299 n=1 Tax=Pungitius pungitius TaxID=134920 RepID=UPI002E0DE62B
MPGRSDLCYYNWRTQVSTSNSSHNFEVIYDDPHGLLFKNKRDNKVLNVDPLSDAGEDSSRTFLQSDLYLHAVIYDHHIRSA